MIAKVFKLFFRPLISSWRRLFQQASLLSGNPTLKLGDSVEINTSSFGEFVYLSSRSRVNNVMIGRFSYCGEGAKVSNAEIGAFTCIGPGVQIGLGNHPTDQIVSVHPAFYSLASQVGTTFVKEQKFSEKPLRTSIGSDVWIGANVVIPGGISIGDGAVIASGAVVVSDVGPFQIVGGVPAKLIRGRFTPTENKILLEAKWWNWPTEELRSRADHFSDIQKFISWYGEGKI
jgi:acetyltransferase-like isoleucine patch superfamily enzyme